MDIKSLIDVASRPERWFRYGDIFELKLTFIPKAELGELVKKHMVRKWDPKTHQRTDELDGKGMLGDFAIKAIKDWRGLTVGGLAKMVPLKGGAKVSRDVLVEFSPENATELLLTAYDLETFVRETVLNLDSFHDDDAEQELGNSEGSQSGS